MTEIEPTSGPVDGWYVRPTGRHILAELRPVLASLLPDLFGYHAVQVGENPAGVDLFEGSRIRRCLRMGLDGGDFIGRAEALPIDGDSIDLVLLLHALEFNDAPHQVLREVDRVLIPDGHVVVVGFNPFSFMGLASLLRLRRGGMPWCGHYYPKRRVCDWLALLGFDIVDVRYASHLPPFLHERLPGRVERLGRWIWRPLGSVCVILARKRVATLTPIRPRWRVARRFVSASGLAGTTNRENSCLRKR